MLRSLRARLLAWVLLPLAAAVALNLWISHRDAQETASVVQDRLLLGSARSIAEQIRFEDGSFEHQIPPAALELFQSSQTDRIYYRVTTSAGHLLAGYTDLPVPTVVAMQPASPIYFDTNMQGSPVRVVAFSQPVVGDPNAGPVLVEVAQTMNAYTALVNNLWRREIRQQLLILALASGLIWLGLQRELKPLRRLQKVFRERAPGTLQPLDTRGMPVELAVLLESLNDYIRRLEAHAGAQAVFIQNAAHQLRTPLTLLNTQVSCAMRSNKADGRLESLAAVRATVLQTVRLVHQLLTLSAAEAMPLEAQAARVLRMDLRQIAQEVMEHLAGRAQARGIDLGMEASEASLHVLAPRLAVREILMNLVDNALRYTQKGGTVTVRLGVDGDGAVRMTVEDNGPGIPTESRERVFERFYRLSDHDSDGSGLGLAIVREFAERCDAVVSLSTPASHVGLLVSVSFMAASRDNNDL